MFAIGNSWRPEMCLKGLGLATETITHLFSRGGEKTSMWSIVITLGPRPAPIGDHSSMEAFNSSIVANSSVEACVDLSWTCGATPASQASFQRLAQMHQRSPGLSPGN